MKEKIKDSGGTTDVYYVYGLNGMIMQQIGTDKQFLIKNHLGSTKVVFVEINNFVSSFDYMPHGHLIRSSIGAEFTYRYTGQEYDEENSLHNFRARVYDSELMAFLGVDPAGQFASPYTAMGNNPVMIVDPDGKFADYSYNTMYTMNNLPFENLYVTNLSLSSPDWVETPNGNIYWNDEVTMSNDKDLILPTPVGPVISRFSFFRIKPPSASRSSCVLSRPRLAVKSTASTWAV